jgi:hypothetical protein
MARRGATVGFGGCFRIGRVVGWGGFFGRFRDRSGEKSAKTPFIWGVTVFGEC